MAIEIKELIIRVTVNNKPENFLVENDLQKSELDKKEIIEECIEKVLEKLERRILR